ncbi:MAG TPA: MFS transporter [Anaerolineae bacterium]|nr:MFS transporter [Anaerolineae bacterium]
MHDSNRWQRPFFLIWGGQAFSLLGSSLVQFALVWWLTQQTGSATVLATATLVAVLPGIVIGPFAGALVDRWSRRWVMVAADAVIALTTAGAVWLAWNGALQPWHVYVIMFVRATGGAFHWPAMQASTSLMVPPQHLARVAGMNQTLYGLMNIMAPPLGALLLSLLALPFVLLIDIATAALAILPLLFIPVPQPPAAPVAAGALRPSMLSDLRAGVRYVLNWPGLLLLMLIATGINFVLTPAFSLMPLLVVDHFQGGPWHLGGLESVFGIGVVLGGLLLSAWGGFKRRIYTSLLGLVGMGVGVTLIGLTPAALFPLALAAMFLAGFTQPLVNGPVMAIMQATVAPEMQGRVFTLLHAVASAMTPLSLAVAGPVADAVGVSPWYVAGGLGCLLMAGLGLLLPPVLHIEDRPQNADAPLAAAAPVEVSSDL